MKTKLDHIYGTAGAVDALETKVSGLETKVTNLGNITAKTNLANTFTANQQINGSLITNNIYKNGGEQELVKIDNQGEKKLYISFRQEGTGYRNHSHIIVRHQKGAQEYNTLFSLKAEDTNSGLKMLVEGNKITFENKTTVEKMVLKELKDMITSSADFNAFKTKVNGW